MQVRGHFHVDDDIWYFAEESLSRSLGRRLAGDENNVSYYARAEQGRAGRYEVAGEGKKTRREFRKRQWNRKKVLCINGYLDLLGRLSSIILAREAQGVGERRLYGDIKSGRLHICATLALIGSAPKNS
jgi:hypothetical protein